MNWQAEPHWKFWCARVVAQWAARPFQEAHAAALRKAAWDQRKAEDRAQRQQEKQQFSLSRQHTKALHRLGMSKRIMQRDD
jgi:hypothetical protein